MMKSSLASEMDSLSQHNWSKHITLFSSVLYGIPILRPILDITHKLTNFNFSGMQGKKTHL